MTHFGDQEGKQADENKNATSGRESQSSTYQNQTIKQPAQYALYTKSAAKHSMHEHKIGQNEDLLDAKIDIVNHNQAYHCRVESQKAVPSASAKNSLGFAANPSDQDVLNSTTKKEHHVFRKSAQAYVNEAWKQNRTGSLDSKHIAGAAARDDSYGVAGHTSADLLQD